MKWEKSGKKQVAQGKNGKFVIESSRGQYVATYIGATRFTMPRKRSIRELKEMCEENFYWEE